MRLLQTAGLLVVATMVAIPLGTQYSGWPGLTEQERNLEQAMRTTDLPSIAQKPAPDVQQVAAEAQPAKKATSYRRKKSVIAAVPKQPEKEEKVAISHYMLRDRNVRREIAQMNLEE